MTHDSIYLDHAATTPLRPEARAAMEHGFAIWANPSSPHKAGRAARAALEDARARVKAALNWDGEVIFTSGASEAAGLARGWAQANEQILSAVEHDSVRNPVYGAKIIFTHLGVGADGAIERAALEAALDEAHQAGEPSLVIVQSINSETGNIQDLNGLKPAITAKGGMLLADCAQSVGKVPLPDADMIIIAAHKFGGPVGVGALLVRDFALLEAPGGQERGYRRGTENLPGVLGMAAALEACTHPYLDPEIIAAVDGFATEVRAAGGVWFSDRLSHPTPFIYAIAMPRLSGQAQLMRFDMAGIAVSQGSACSSGSMRRSHVLTAMGVEDDLADRTIRMSIGWTTKVADIVRFAEVWLAMARAA